MSHVPVLLPEVLDALAPLEGATVLDATFGGGGYSRAMLAAGASVIGLDRDPAAVARGRLLEQEAPGRFTMVESAFSALDEAVTGPIEGVVLDVGVSSFQIDQAGRGFSFQKEGPLDMRMAGAGPTAADALAHLTEAELAAIFFAYGEEREARRVARAIVTDRAAAPFVSTLQLAGLVERVVGRRGKEAIHPATRVFQGLRVFINDELNELHCALCAAERALAEGGRLVVVSFHSLEDRIVKTFLAERTRVGTPSRHVPVARGPAPTFAPITHKAVQPGEAEVVVNPRARSARLRAARRTSTAPRPAEWRPPAGVPDLETLERRLAANPASRFRTGD